MLGVGLSHGLQQQPGFLDVVDVTAVGWQHGLQVCQVPLGVHYCLAAHRVRHLSGGNENDTCGYRSVRFL